MPSDRLPSTPSDRTWKRAARNALIGLGAWILVGVLWGAQTSLGATVRGAKSVPLATAITDSLLQLLPWMLVTPVVLGLAMRFPLSGDRWKRNAIAHAVAAPLVSFVVNVLVVLRFWQASQQFGSIATLAQQGAIWGTVNFHITLLVYAAIVAVAQMLLYYARTQSRELQLARLESQLTRARLQALNAQIRPHFLFNTLHTIGQLWRTGRNDDADAVLDHLGSLFHKVQHSTARFQVPLGEELDLVREYLAIESVRFRDRLQHSILADERALECLVPPLLLQPLVENAVRHGISAVSTAGRIDVLAERTPTHLVLTVRDDGPGLNGASRHPGSGTGLSNTRERLAQLYGDDASMLLSDAAGGGSLVTIRIPASSNDRWTDDAAASR